MARSSTVKKHDIRLTSGQFRGQSINFRHAKARPSTQRTREAMINILRSHTCLNSESQVAVLFAGSGAVGFEVASAFQATPHMVDNDPKCLFSIQAQATKFGLHVPTIRASVRDSSWLTQLPKVDGVLADPPYRNGWSDDLGWLTEVVNHTQAQWYLLETETSAEVQASVRRQLPNAREYTYGNTQLWFGKTVES